MQNNLNSGDGMSVDKSTIQDRREALEMLQEHVSEDCVKYGFYIGKISGQPVADYGNCMVENEINKLQLL